MDIRVEVQSWGGDCGPEPRSTTASGGGTFRISQSGDQLTFHLRRERTTRSCWSENRAVRRVSSSYQAGTWRIVCRTPADDSRAETGTYTIRAIGQDRLQFQDESRYDWQLNESSCRARIVTTQTFSRVAASPPVTQTPPQPDPPERCTPSEPARIILRPSSADVQPGGEQCFTARVVDAAGCTVRPATLTVAEGDPGTIVGRCYQAALMEGRARVVASSGRLSAEASISVRPMDLSDLIARRSETGSVGSGTPELEDASSRTAARVSAREAEAGPGLLWSAVAFVVSLLLLGFAVILLRARRTKKKRGIAGLPGVEISEPELEPPPPSASALPPESSGPREDLICPRCRRGYPPHTTRCPHDDTELMPYREFAAGTRPGGNARPRVCPMCGQRYAATVKFCGKDGATLEDAAHE